VLSEATLRQSQPIPNANRIQRSVTPPVPSMLAANAIRRQGRLTPPLPSMTQVAPRLFIGNLPSAVDRSLLERNNIRGVVSLGTGRWGFWNSVALVTRDYVPQQNHTFIACVDSGIQNLLVHMEDICDYVEYLFASMAKEGSSGAVLVHCDRGVSPSATVAIGYLMRKWGQKFEDTFAIVRAARKVNPNYNFRDQLRIWEQVGYNVWENRASRTPKAPYQAFLDALAAEMAARRSSGRERMAGLLVNLSVATVACK
jgi:protein-tyrosine phosphatase